jgi:AraC-like DNA-binding protein
MSPNGQVVLLASVPMPLGTVFRRHSHPVHQLAWTDTSVLEVETAEGVWVLPPTRALWLPAGVLHETRATGPAVLRGIYLDPDRSRTDWSVPTPIAVGPMLAALLRYLEGDLEQQARERGEALLPDLLEPVTAVTIDLPLPTDPRARDVADAILADPADARTLTHLGHDVGASARTLSRGFSEGTGMTFGRWRAAARMRAALPLLAQGQSVNRVAAAVGYDTPSAFVAAFRRVTGTTPGTLFSRER